MTIQYYLYENDSEQGPFTLEEIRAKNLKKETAVWYTERDTWTTADELPELKDLLWKTLNAPPKDT